MNNRTPRRGTQMSNEKAKDFKSAIKRLFRELKGFKFLIQLSLILALLSSVLSIIAPSKLSKLTDQISQGLVINSTNLDKITNNIRESFVGQKAKQIVFNILDINFDEAAIAKIMNSDISEEDKNTFKNMLLDINEANEPYVIQKKVIELPNSIFNIILTDSFYDNVLITKEDKIQLLSLFDTENMITFYIPKNVQNIMLKDFEIDGIVVTKNDQVSFLELLNSLNETSDSNIIYSNLDKLPDSIKSLIEPTMNIEFIKRITLFLVILYLSSALFNYIQSISMTDVSNKFARKLRSQISTKINKLPLIYFDNHTIGDILSRVTNDVDTVAQSMNNSLATLVSSVTLFIGSIIMMFVTNWIMALTAILSSIFGFGFMFKVLGKSQKYFVSRQTELGNLNGHIEEVYSGLNVVKAYNGKKQSDEKFDLYNRSVYNANMKSQFLSGLMMPIMNFIGNFGYVAVCIVGSLLTMKGAISFGVIVAFISYVRIFISPLSQIAQAMTAMQSTAAASERVFEFIDQKEMSDQKNIKKQLNRNSVKGDIEFKNVMFKYDGNESPTIHNFSAKVSAGQKIAIVGPTGAGKTTMVNLLMKFYEINSGDIIIDGVSINDLTRENIHSLFTMVLQDTWLFNGTVKENIIYNRENVSDKRVEEVCKIVGLDHFIRTLPNGYNSVISDNDSVSAGQRQLLTIARGMIEDSPFLILDEATSNVDTRTEELVQNAMDKLTVGRTSFIIAHRLSTIKNADLILVMKDGNIIEQGNHDTLMKENGFYSGLYNSQFEL